MRNIAISDGKTGTNETMRSNSNNKNVCNKTWHFWIVSYHNFISNNLMALTSHLTILFVYNVICLICLIEWDAFSCSFTSFKDQANWLGLVVLFAHQPFPIPFRSNTKKKTKTKTKQQQKIKMKNISQYD